MFTNTSGSAVYLKLHQDYLHHTQILTLTQLHTIYAIFGTYSEAPSRPKLIDNCINIKCYYIIKRNTWTFRFHLSFTHPEKIVETRTLGKQEMKTESRIFDLTNPEDGAGAPYSDFKKRREHPQQQDCALRLSQRRARFTRTSERPPYKRIHLSSTLRQPNGCTTWATPWCSYWAQDCNSYQPRWLKISGCDEDSKQRCQQQESSCKEGCLGRVDLKLDLEVEKLLKIWVP